MPFLGTGVPGGGKCLMHVRRAQPAPRRRSVHGVRRQRFHHPGAVQRCLAQFERTLDTALQREWTRPRNIDALLEYARRIRDKEALVVIATEEHALEERHLSAIRTIARTHPMVLIDVATINPFDVSHARVVLDGAGKRRVPAFLRRGNTAGQVRTHREYLAASIRHELNRCGSTVIRSDSSERMFHEFVRMVSTALAQSTRNQLRAPSVLSLGDKA